MVRKFTCVIIIRDRDGGTNHFHTARLKVSNKLQDTSAKDAEVQAKPRR